MPLRLLMVAARVGVVALAVAWSVAENISGALAIGVAEPPPHERDHFAALDRAITDFLNDHGIPGAVVAIARGEEVLLERGYGWKDLARTEAMPANALMRIASISKPFVAAVIHTLIEEGTLSPDDRVFALPEDGRRDSPSSPGILHLDPWPAPGDHRLGAITDGIILDEAFAWPSSAPVARAP